MALVRSEGKRSREGDENGIKYSLSALEDSGARGVGGGGGGGGVGTFF